MGSAARWKSAGKSLSEAIPLILEDRENDVLRGVPEDSIQGVVTESDYG